MTELDKFIERLQELELKAQEPFSGYQFTGQNVLYLAKAVQADLRALREEMEKK